MSHNLHESLDLMRGLPNPNLFPISINMIIIFVLQIIGTLDGEMIVFGSFPTNCVRFIGTNRRQNNHYLACCVGVEIIIIEKIKISISFNRQDIFNQRVMSIS